ncbi:hypothetical protein BGZ61DRAFT_484889 [Ilyonectria robusta]|uniref:uncharacterized protein n=1 Tax=Ilyonectria robusta TaxID=1079257 RepID=UPI001E8D81B5|nr:uncharacterized protein BGZ61DRAFT_484889 [Ilyonectria robusta]KAH8663831.1 hypothetical protein BGZ61DRAFT_484889 [Ilyonectria robusta]
MFAARRLIARPFMRVATRHIHATCPRFAAASPPNMPEMMMNDPKVRETFEKLSRHPPAIAAMQKVGDIIKGKGFDATKPPSKMDMMRLMMDKQFQEAAQTLYDEMQNAGIEMDSDVGSTLPHYLSSLY